MQMLREDVTDPTGLGYDPSAASAVPADFKSYIVTALWAKQIDVLRIPSDQLDKLVTDAWSNQLAQDAYNADSTDPLAFAGNLQTTINDLLFSTSSSDQNLAIEATNLRLQQGQTLTKAEQNLIGIGDLGAFTAGENVPNPFGQPTTVSGNDYGQQVDPNSASGGYGPIHLGVDYGTAPGTPLAAPFAGTVTVDIGIADYGNRVTLTLDNGYKLVFGHVASGVASGRVNPGDVIAISGQNIGDSIGAVTLVEWRDPSGNFLNPHDILDPIQKGTTFSQMEATLGAKIVGSGLAYDSTLDAQFSGAASAFRKFYGRNPTPAELASIIKAGGAAQNVQQMTDYVRSLPSHIAGMTNGQYTDLRTAADGISSAVLGHPTTDGIVKELFDAGHLTDKAITNWYNFHGNTGLTAAQYNAAYSANQPYWRSIYNESGADPRVIAAQAQQAGAVNPPATDQAQAAANLNPEPGWDTPWNAAQDTPPPREPAGGGKPRMMS